MANTVFMSAPTKLGFLVRIVGRGTFTESPMFREFVKQCLDADPRLSVFVDVSQCEYCDSTFMGCLIWLHKYAESGTRLKFFASAEKGRELFGLCMLDRVLNFIAECPLPAEEYVVLTMSDIESNEMGRQIAECQQRLTDLGSRNASSFPGVEERIRRDLHN